MVSQTVMLVEPRQRSKREGIPDYDRGEETMLGTTVNGWCGRQRAFRYGHIEDARVWADTMLCCFATSEAEHPKSAGSQRRWISVRLRKEGRKGGVGKEHVSGRNTKAARRTLDDVVEVSYAT